MVGVVVGGLGSVTKLLTCLFFINRVLLILDNRASAIPVHLNRNLIINKSGGSGVGGLGGGGVGVVRGVSSVVGDGGGIR